MSYSLEALKQELSRDELRVAKAYKDSLGILTGGVGRNLEQVPFSDAEIDLMLQTDIGRAENGMDRLFPAWRDLSDARQRVLLNMTFNIGQTRFSGFHEMWAALQAQDYEAVAREMLDSKWAVQVGERATRLAQMMREG